MIALSWLPLIVLLGSAQISPAQAAALAVTATYLPGDTANGENYWQAVLRDPGASTLTVSGQRVVKIAVSSERLTALRKAIVAERFFDLRKEYGYFPVGGPERRVTIDSGGKTHQVSVFSIKPEMSKQESAEVDRALRVWFAALDCLQLREKLR